LHARKIYTYCEHCCLELTVSPERSVDSFASLLTTGNEASCWLSIIRMIRRDGSIYVVAVSFNVRVAMPPLISTATNVGTGYDVARSAPALSAPGSELWSFMLFKQKRWHGYAHELEHGSFLLTD
jgi:hypothetical protein